jgi:tetratricopeptide (TPR) repeat protein
MQSALKFLTLFLSVLILPNAALAISPHEQFKQMVEQLQKNPTDDTLRASAIKFALKLKPAPAIPQEARRYLARGIAAFETGKNLDELKLALPEFQNASNAAPWWPDPYFNLAKVQEKVGDYKSAINSYHFYLISAPHAKDVEAIQTLSYKLEFMAEQKAKDDEIKAKENEKKLQRQQWAANEANLRRANYGGLVDRMGTAPYNDVTPENPNSAQWNSLGNHLNMDNFDPDIRPDNYRFAFSVGGTDQDQLKMVIPWTNQAICLDYDHQYPDSRGNRFVYCGDPIPNFKGSNEYFVTFGTATNGSPWIQVIYACENNRCAGLRFRLER